MKFRRRTRWALCAIGIVVAIFTISEYTASGGRGLFSPDTLEWKTQSELLFPLTDVPIYRSVYSNHRSPLVSDLITKGYWTTRSSDKPRWLFMFRWNEQWRDGQSELHREMTSYRGKEWIEWSDAHPEIAAVLWPRVLGDLRSDVNNPQSRAVELMRMARASETIEQYEELIGNNTDLQ